MRTRGSVHLQPRPALRGRQAHRESLKNAKQPRETRRQAMVPLIAAGLTSAEAYSLAMLEALEAQIEVTR